MASMQSWDWAIKLHWNVMLCADLAHALLGTLLWCSALMLCFNVWQLLQQVTPTPTPTSTTASTSTPSPTTTPSPTPTTKPSASPPPPVPPPAQAPPPPINPNATALTATLQMSGVNLWWGSATPLSSSPWTLQIQNQNIALCYLLASWGGVGMWSCKNKICIYAVKNCTMEALQSNRPWPGSNELLCAILMHARQFWSRCWYKP